MKVILFFLIFHFVLWGQENKECSLKLAEASRLAYYPEEQAEIIVKGPLKNFQKIHDTYEKKSGFGAIAYLNINTKELIIAYRGTNNWKDFVADSAIGEIAIFENDTISTHEAVNDILINSLLNVSQDSELTKKIKIYLLLSELFKGESTLSEAQKELADVAPDLALKLNNRWVQALLKKRLNKEKKLEKKLEKEEKKRKRMEKFKKISQKIVPKKWRFSTNAIKKVFKKMAGSGIGNETHLRKNLKRSEDFLNISLEKCNEKFPKIKLDILLTGHSLGGGYAKGLATLLLQQGYHYHTEAFGAPGMREVLLKLTPLEDEWLKQASLNSLITTHRHEDDVVPKVGKHLGKQIFLKNPILSENDLQKIQDSLRKDSKEEIEEDKMQQKIKEGIAILLLNHKIEKYIESLSQ